MKTFWAVVIAILLSSAFPLIAEDPSADFALSFLVTEGFGPEAGYVSFLGIPQIDIRFFYKDLVYAAAVANIMNTMGSFSSYGLGAGIEYRLFNLETTFCWTSGGYAGEYPNFVKNDYRDLNVNVGFMIPLDFVLRPYASFGPCFIFGAPAVDRMRELYFPVRSIFWNARIGFSTRPVSFKNIFARHR